MKKIVGILSLMLLLVLPAHAQFEKGTWIVNPAVTGMDFTFSNAQKAHFGMDVQGGAFLIDNVALLVNAGFDLNKRSANVFNLGVAGRYYFNKCGVFLGTGFNMDHWKWEGEKENNVNWRLEAGYAFFIARNVTIEPSVYYNLSMSDMDWSKFGLRLGFGLYF